MLPEPFLLPCSPLRHRFLDVSLLSLLVFREQGNEDKGERTLSVNLWVEPETILHPLEFLNTVHSLGFGFRVYET